MVGPVAGLVFRPDGTFTYTPPENFTGEVSFDYTVNDGLATSAAQTFTITVEGVNEPPVPAAEGNSNSTPEDTVLNGSVPAGSDADGDDLTYALVGPVAGLVFRPDGTFTYTPPENFTGEVSFDYTVNDGLATSAAQTFTITVEGVNEPPVPAAEGNSNSTPEDTVLNGSVPAGSDADGDDLTYALVGPVAGLVFRPDGTFTYTPPENFTGEVSFDYTVNDGLATSAAQTFTITVEGVNEPPVPAAEGNGNSTPRTRF